MNTPSLHIQIITLFPESCEHYLSTGLLQRAQKEGGLLVTCHHLRQFAMNKHGQIDDSPYGGGSGMILRPESAVRAIEHARAIDPGAKVILPSPRGARLTQEWLRSQLGAKPARVSTSSVATEGEAVTTEPHSVPQAHTAPPTPGLIILCNRYEGVDERVIQSHVDEEVSIGDFILMGGELAALCILEGLARLLPGVLGNPDSPLQESFQDGLLEAPHYTKPQMFDGVAVPEVLLSGDHGKVDLWRREQAIEVTCQRRPELITRSGRITPKGELTVALIHYPVLDKQGDVVTTSITNIDVHDISRSSRTFGLERFYVVHPTKVLRKLVEKIATHWESGAGREYNPNRSDALSLLSIVPYFDDVLTDIEERTGQLPKIIYTSARRSAKTISSIELRARMSVDPTPHLLILGTGWGLTSDFEARASYVLEPIEGPTSYNHLSVRAAAAIMFDRLLCASHDRPYPVPSGQ